MGADDATSWRRVAVEWSAIGRPPLAAYAGWRAAEAAAAGGDRALAQTSLSDAYRIASSLGATPIVDACRSLATRSRMSLEADAPTPVVEADADPFGLTERERAVLTLVARGYTNRQIGTELFISESTAGVHVSNILGKLGVTSRTEAAAIAVRLDLAG